MKSVVKMTLEQVVDLYEQRFGGIPLEIMRGLSDDKIKEILTQALETDKEVTFKRGVKH